MRVDVLMSDAGRRIKFAYQIFIDFSAFSVAHSNNAENSALFEVKSVIS